MKILSIREKGLIWPNKANAADAKSRAADLRRYMKKMKLAKTKGLSKPGKAEKRAGIASK